MHLIEGRATISDVGGFVADLNEVADRHDATVQAFDARYVVSARHLQRAVDLADRARERGDAIADDRGVEILLYAAGRRQISDALEMGVEEGERELVVLVDGGDEERATEKVRERLQPAETLGGFDEDLITAFFEIGERERAATDAPLEELVLERVALLVVER